MINPQGFRRSQPVRLEKPPNTQRIIVIGDSMTAAFEVPEEKTFEALLERKLNESGHQKYEVLNAGVRGYGADQCEIWLSREGVKDHPDAVIYLFCSNDISDIMNRKNKPYYTLQGDEMELHLPSVTSARRAQYWLRNLYLRRLIRRIHDLRKLDDPIVGRMTTPQEREYRRKWYQETRSLDAHSTQWRLMSGIIKRMNETCRKIGAKLYVTSGVVIFEADDDILRQIGGDRQRDGEDPFRFRERLMAICRAQGIPYVETHHPIVQYYRTHHENLWWKTDNHFNEKGHALMAQVLYDTLKESMSQ